MNLGTERFTRCMEKPLSVGLIKKTKLLLTKCFENFTISKSLVENDSWEHQFACCHNKHELKDQWPHSPYSLLRIPFDTDKENSFNNQSFLGWWSFPLLSWIYQMTRQQKCMEKLLSTLRVERIKWNINRKAKQDYRHEFRDMRFLLYLV